jgi:hypothetical protein
MWAVICLAFLGRFVASVALAQTSCVAPGQPAAIDGATATLDELKAAISIVKQFIASSDAYQACLGKEIDVQKAAATPTSRSTRQSLPAMSLWPTRIKK